MNMETKKSSAYQKLKQANLALKQDIYKILKGEFLEKEETKNKWLMAFNLEELIWGKNGK